MLPWLLFLEVTGGGLSVREERRESLHHLLEEVGSREHHLELEGNKNFVKGEVDKVEEEEEEKKVEEGGERERWRERRKKRRRGEGEEGERKSREKQKRERIEGRESVLLKGCCEGRERGAGGPE